MKITFLLFWCLLFIGGCCNCKKTVKKEEIDYKSSIKLSPGTQNFAMRLESEIKEGNDILKFQPSENLIEDFSILMIKDAYYVGGMCKTNSDIDTLAVESLGVKIGTKAGNIWTVKIPLIKFNEVLKLNCIEYLQIDEKVKRK